MDWIHSGEGSVPLTGSPRVVCEGALCKDPGVPTRERRGDLTIRPVCVADILHGPSSEVGPEPVSMPGEEYSNPGRHGPG